MTEAVTIWQVYNGLGSAASLTSWAQSVLKNPGADDKNKQRAVSILTALRSLYFSPKGILKVLDSIAKRRSFDRGEASRLLLEFNQAETDVLSSIREIPQVFDREDIGMPPDAFETLQTIIYNKETARQRVKDLLNGHLTFKREVSPKEAKKLAKKIRKLNKAIAKADRLVRSHKVN